MTFSFYPLPPSHLTSILNRYYTDWCRHERAVSRHKLIEEKCKAFPGCKRISLIPKNHQFVGQAYLHLMICSVLLQEMISLDRCVVDLSGSESCGGCAAKSMASKSKSQDIYPNPVDDYQRFVNAYKAKNPYHTRKQVTEEATELWRS